MKDPYVYVYDILESVKAIAVYTDGMSREAFLDNQIVQDAVLRRLQIIGEAAKRVPGDFREKFSEVPWSKMARTRDRITHQYEGVKLELVWSIVVNELPPLLARLKEILADCDAG